MERPRGELAALPRHPLPELPADLAAWTLSVRGLAATPLQLTLAELHALGQAPLTADFACEEGWVVRDLHWAGVPVAAVLARAQPLPAARFLAVSGAGFVAVLSLEEVEKLKATLALDLDGGPIAVPHGGPIRLVLDGGACYQGVKWVDQLILVEDESLETARTVALGRIGRGR